MRTAFFAACLLTTNLIPLPAQSVRPVSELLKEARQVQRFADSTISPDGKWLAWVERGQNGKTDELITAPSANPARRLTVACGAHGSCRPSDPSWSPDSSHLIFLSEEAGRQKQIYSVAAGQATATRLSALKGNLTSPRYSPDSKWIALLMTEGVDAGGGPLAASAPETGVMEEKIDVQRLAIFDPQSKQARALSAPGFHVYEYDWSPRSDALTYTAAEGFGDNNWWVAQLYRVDRTGGQQKLVCKPPYQIAEPRWSPDGASIAFISGVMSDQGVTGGDIYLVDASGGEPVNQTPARKASPNWLRWIASSGRLLFGETVDGGFAISEWDPKSGQTERLWQGDVNFDFGAVASDGRSSITIYSSWQQPPEVHAGKIGEWKPVTQANAALKPAWGRAEKIHWTNGDLQAEGWLLAPQTVEPGKKYPMVVSVHGGPASQKSPSWPSAFFDLSLLANRGFFVFFPNPRGSYGQGEAFTRGNIKDFGYGDLSDIQAGVDAVLKSAPVDGERLGIAGWSYGGYMTMWTVTQTQRFKAAVAGAGVANWQSYYGQNLIDQWMIPFFGASVYDDPAAYAKSSPINYVKNVKTPTLVVVGERDAECPAPQSREFWHALKTLGVKTQLVIYPNEGHRFNDPKHIQDVTERTLAWFEEHLR